MGLRLWWLYAIRLSSFPTALQPWGHPQGLPDGGARFAGSPPGQRQGPNALAEVGSDLFVPADDSVVQAPRHSLTQEGRSIQAEPQHLGASVLPQGG